MLTGHSELMHLKEHPPQRASIIVVNRRSRTLSPLHQFWGNVPGVMNVKGIYHSSSISRTWNALQRG
jgi:hypothetical protein